jgi:uncharacterized protein YggU (UPF0235/DUF167 family)
MRRKTTARVPAPRPGVPPRVDVPALLDCVRHAATGARLDVIVSPHAPATRLDGLHDGALRVRLAAAPVDGKANDALLAWLAVLLDVPRAALSLAAGHGAHRKRVDIALDAASVSARLRARLPAT